MAHFHFALWHVHKCDQGRSHNFQSRGEGYKYYASDASRKKLGGCTPIWHSIWGTTAAKRIEALGQRNPGICLLFLTYRSCISGHNQCKEHISLKHISHSFETAKITAFEPTIHCEKFLNILYRTEICTILAYLCLTLVAIATRFAPW